jgi:eukaryotic-like serine/threonine-protein kinase
MIGTQLGKTYQIIDKIDEGGMGVVYQVEHQTLHKRFAAKILASGLAANPEALRRFEIEAHAASKLEHENIVNVTDYGVAEDGRPYLVMELLKGKTLYQRLLEGPLSLQETVAVIVPVCRALSAAHAEGFVHRDVKPENIFLTQRPMGRFGIKVLDFGITRFRAENTRLTKMGQALGSPLYMAPETCRGEAIDYRADIYSVGVLIYQLICGQLPFYDDNLLKVIHLQVAQPLRPPRELVPDMPEALDLVIRTALEKDPADRYQTVDELEDQLLASLPPEADTLLNARRTPLSVPVATISTPFPAISGTSGSMPVVPSASGPSPTSDSGPALVVASVQMDLPARRAGSRGMLIAVLLLLLLVGSGIGAFVVLRGKSSTSASTGSPVAATGAARHAASNSRSDTGVVARSDDGGGDPSTARERVVSVTTRPDGARVELDGVFVGTTPLEVKAPHSTGMSSLIVAAKGFKPIERTVRGNEDVVLSLALEPSKQLTKQSSKRVNKHEQPVIKPKPPAPNPDDQLEIRGAR